MKRFLRNFGAMFLTGLMVVSAAAGCAGDPALNSATDIQIYLWDSGYGSEFMIETVEGFNQAQSEYHATLDYTSSASTIISTLGLGSSNTYDLYFTMLNTNMYNKDFAKLDDVLDSPAFGETETIRSKYYPYLLKGVANADGTTNFLTYGNGWCGLVYNSEIVDDEKYFVPRTTNELSLLTAELAGDSITPWLFYNDSNNNGYWNYAVQGWEAQYDGIDYYYNTMFALKDENGNTPSKEVMLRKDGRYQALKVLESLLTPSTVHPEVTSGNFTKVQTLFLAGEAAMTVNGSWLMNESTGSKDNFVMMKLPVISSIVEKLEDKQMSDGTLSDIVKEVDEGATSSDLCSQNDFDRIKEARNLLYNNGSESYVFIPSYSPAVEGAKEFLRYFYSDEGTLAFMRNDRLPGPVRLTDASKFDVESLPKWNRTQFEFSQTLTAVTNTLDKSKVFLNYSLNQFANLTYAQYLCAMNPKDRKNADDLWQTMTNRVNENWSDWSA